MMRWRSSPPLGEEWYDKTLRSRLNSQAKGANHVMQRLL